MKNPAGAGLFGVLGSGRAAKRLFLTLILIITGGWHELRVPSVDAAAAVPVAKQAIFGVY
jgi:hypothetical protein